MQLGLGYLKFGAFYFYYIWYHFSGLHKIFLHLTFTIQNATILSYIRFGASFLFYHIGCHFSGLCKIWCILLVLYRVRQLIQSMDKFACFGLYTEFETTKSHVGISLTLEDKANSGNF